MPNDMVAKACVFVRSPSTLSQNYRRIEVIFTDLAVIATDRPTASLVSKTHEAFFSWRRTTFSDRAGLMRKAAEILHANAGEYAHLTPSRTAG
jgi:acyl-CoA reductase-like NAD-dependent aldehyde dehydrogenase